jgi:hypothetical protein
LGRNDVEIELWLIFTGKELGEKCKKVLIIGVIGQDRSY